jgi:hypothetical protein
MVAETRVVTFSRVIAVLPPYPALLSKMPSRSLAKAPLRAGSWSSTVPMKCWQNASAGRPGDPETAVAEARPASVGVLDGDGVPRELGHDASVPPRRRTGVSVTSLHWCAKAST